jgi:hypothetical protein
MRFEPQQFDEERRATALRAFFVTLLFSLMALWAFGGTSLHAHSQVRLDRQPFEQGARRAAAANQHALAAKLEGAKPRALAALDLSAPPILADSYGAATPTLLGLASWHPDAGSGSDEDAHHYAATGPPGRQLS